MKHIVVQDWNKYNRSDRIKSIVAALKRSGKTEVEYFKGRLYLARLLLGKGHPKHVLSSKTFIGKRTSKTCE
ncbi:MAG: hypothetical protein HXS48_08200 [Theionarchaea archaeon]|nr:hypothetical protein [Theionarchaea archaeon]